MIHEILKILDTTDLQELEKQRITTVLLRLFNVVGQRELLCDFVDFYNNRKLSHERIFYDEIDIFLESV